MVETRQRVGLDRGAGPKIAELVRMPGGHLITYLTGGAVTALLYYVILVAGLRVLGRGVPYLYVVVASHFLTVVMVYPWYRLVVFPGGGESWIAGYLRFYAVGIGFLAWSLAGLPVLVEWAGLPILTAQFILIVTSLPLNYAMNRLWAFRDRGRS
ncbi:GtrA family protein [Sphaerisporangium album]|uniref:GtrA family protein n=1 Tax=Sphaerisporangium album TaxID=509200 RepID=A0A367FGE0_9ACTN|nr:GtrA family protein [Sphaerisporangium album]RCG29391.1 GtrA family protein [Sphaerisporangium album]